jgi:hypothetical protein
MNEEEYTISDEFSIVWWAKKTPVLRRAWFNPVYQMRTREVIRNYKIRNKAQKFFWNNNIAWPEVIYALFGFVASFFYLISERSFSIYDSAGQLSHNDFQTLFYLPFNFMIPTFTVGFIGLGIMSRRISSLVHPEKPDSLLITPISDAGLFFSQCLPVCGSIRIITSGPFFLMGMGYAYLLASSPALSPFLPAVSRLMHFVYGPFGYFFLVMCLAIKWILLIGLFNILTGIFSLRFPSFIAITLAIVSTIAVMFFARFTTLGIVKGIFPGYIDPGEFGTPFDWFPIDELLIQHRLPHFLTTPINLSITILYFTIISFMGVKAFSRMRRRR